MDDMVLITPDERKRLNDKAKLKGAFQVLKVFPPARLAIMCVGKIIGYYGTIEECEAAIDALEPYVIVKPETVAAEWTAIPQLSPPPPRRCNAGFGGDCLCLTNDPDSDDITIWCVVTDCDYPASHAGACTGHYGNIKLFGDLTKNALKRTDAMWQRLDEECSHGIGYHGAAETQARWDRGERQRLLSLKQMSQTGSNQNSRSAAETAVLGELLGVEIRPVGDGYFSIIDKDGTILAYHNNRAELLEQFYG